MFRGDVRCLSQISDVIKQQLTEKGLRYKEYECSTLQLMSQGQLMPLCPMGGENFPETNLVLKEEWKLR